MELRKIDAQVNPKGSLEFLSQLEVEGLRSASRGRVYDLFRRCSLAVLNTGTTIDDAALIFEQYRDYDVEILQSNRGIKLKIYNAPASAFVDGEMIKGIKEHLFAVLRDVVYISTEIEQSGKFDLSVGESITNAVFNVLRNARIWKVGRLPNLVVCWGGHSIGRREYDYTKDVGYELGLRGLHLCTGCGPGAMKGPMKGAAVGHAKQRRYEGRYIGITEPGIIAAEPPNPIVNHLVVMPDIEKRLEAFVRAGHGVVVFPGGVGTTEEILFLLGMLMHPNNAGLYFPLIFTGPRQSADYFEQIDTLIEATLGKGARNYYQIIIGDPPEVARAMERSIDQVRRIRKANDDAFYFNWLLHLPEALQQPFEVTHESMAQLELRRDMEPHQLAANLRRAFSGIVTGNVKENGIRMIAQHGPFEIRGDAAIMRALKNVLEAFVAQKRMKLSGAEYEPCYRVVA